MALATITDTDKQLMDDFYRENEMLFLATVRRWIAKFGGDFDELLGEAHLAFVSAWHGFDESKGAKFTTFLTRCMQNRFRDVSRLKTKQCRDERRTRPIGDEEQFSVADTTITGVRYAFSSLGQSVVDAILALPIDVSSAFAGAQGKKLRPLLVEKGMSSLEIESAFRDIAKAVNQEKRPRKRC